MELKVEKKDGTTEQFDRSKIVSGVIKAGATPEEAESVAAQVETWAGTAVGGVVKTTDIWGKVVESLFAINPTVGATFRNYTKSA